MKTMGTKLFMSIMVNWKFMVNLDKDIGVTSYKLLMWVQQPLKSQILRLIGL
jgi:hypothetical protein